MPWKQPLSYGTAKYFLVVLNFPVTLFWSVFFPIEYARIRFNSGSPTGVAQIKRTSSTHFIIMSSREDLLMKCVPIGMGLWYLQTIGSQYALFPIFRLLPSSIGVCFDYVLEVMIRTVKNENTKTLRYVGRRQRK